MPFRLPLPLIIALITGAILGPVCGFHFLSYDDALNIYENPYVVHLTPSNLLHFWQAPFAQLYIPLTYTTWSLLAGVSRLFFPGSEGQIVPYLFHSANLLLHLANVLLVYALAKRLGSGGWAAAAGALLFALHPVQVEAVAWATGLKDLLSGFFSLLALWGYVRFVQEAPGREGRWGGWQLYTLATFSLVCALLAKPGAVVLPALAYVTGFALLGRSQRQLARELLPWLALTLPVIVITQGAQAQEYAGFVPSLWERLLIASDSLSFYLGKILWPALLTVDYGRVPLGVLGQKTLLLTALGPWLAALLLLGIRQKWRRSEPLACALLFTLALLPVSGLIPFTYQGISTVADRYLYLAMVGPALALTYFLLHYHPRPLLLLLLLLLTALGARSSIQLRQWHDSETFYTRTIATSPWSWFAWNNYGRHLENSGRLPEAERAYRQALRINPFYARAYSNLGNLLEEQGRDQEALAAFQQAMRIAPGNEEPYLNIGDLHRDDRRWPEAEHFYRKAAALRPDLALAQANLGVALKKMGRLREALAPFQKAVALDPNFAEVYNNLGIVYRKLGQPKEAVAAFRRAISLKEEFVEAHNNLGHLYLLQGFFTEALPLLKKAAALAPAQPVPLDNLGQAYEGLGRHREALSAFWQAVKADASYLPARENLTRIQAELEKEEAAGGEGDE